MGKITKLRSVSLIITVAILTVVFTGCAQKKQSENFYAMGSFVSQSVYTSDKELLESVKQDILKEEKLISHRISGSDVDNLNKNKTAQVDKDTYELLKNAVEFGKNCNGVFDISLLSLTSIWDFDGENPHVPDNKLILEALEKTGYENIVFSNDSTVTLNGDIMLDLGGLGKGYACDIAVKKYKDAGVSGIVAVGGSIGVNGVKPDDKYFVVGIRDPFSEDSNDVFAQLSLKNKFVSTSGSYEKKFTEENTLYHHILDPKTGYPVRNNLVSVSVVCDSGVLSDMLSTACFALGVENSIPLLKKYNAQAVFVTDDKKVIATEGLKYDLTVYEGFTESWV